MTSTTFVPTAGASILGYELLEPIGSGGYGEVWKVRAPGGIDKAIKFVFGVADGSRAQVELKALDKIKEVRHPFLLSLDRVEPVDGRLVIVTELASGSLADIYSQRLNEGHLGIPREELLQYMRDSADALDYLSNTHSLQHLDIKPENLLVLSGHVKVADFGLVKNIQNVTQSLMNGLTPSYAPPELFDGTPSAFSDQYSLAIVYQEMLTGQRPFSGTTPAQLAAQHMHGKPDLSTLTKGDQFVLQKALAKNPTSRFQSCSELVEELCNRKRRVKAKPRPGRGLLRQTEQENGTVLLDATSPDVTNRLTAGNMPIKNASVQAAAAPELDQYEPSAHPTLVIGIGKTGTNVARQLRRLFNQRVSGREELPSIQLLCLDTDRKSLAQAVCSLENDSLDSSETLEIPLASAQEFRDKSGKFSGWLSRRWIYNIPKSLQTEGLRPLGRLAFAHHAEKIYDKLRKSVEGLTATDNLARTAETLQLPPDELPRVVVVASSAGGLGSGSAMDVAYTVRTVLSDMGWQECQIDGILMHATAKIMGNRELNVANSFACLAELQHVAEYGYPGDESCGLPDFEEELPFDNTYFLNLGDAIDPAGYAGRIDEVAEYLFLDIATPCQSFFEATREISEEFGLRSFGIRYSGVPNRSQLDEELTQSLIQRWVDRGAGGEKIDAELAEMTRQFGFDSSVEQTCWLTESKKLFHQHDPELLSGIVDRTGAKLDELLVTISQQAGEAIEKCGGDQSLGEWLEAQLDARFETAKSDFQERIRRAAGEPGIRLGGGSVILEQLRRQLTQLLIEYDRNQQQIEKYQNDTIAEMQLYFKSTKPSREYLMEQVDRLCSMMIHQQVIECCRNDKLRWKSVIADCDAQLNELSRNAQLMGRLSDPGPLDLLKSMDEPRSASVSQVVENALASKLPELVEQLDRWIDRSLGEDRKLLDCLDDNSPMYRRMPDLISTLARKLLALESRKLNLDQLLIEEGFTAAKLETWIAEQIGDSRPGLKDCGGVANFLVAVPEQSETLLDVDFVQEKSGVEPSVIRATYGQLATCFEHRNIPLSNVAFRLLENHPECFELVERIHCRCDVNWIKANQVFG